MPSPAAAIEVTALAKRYASDVVALDGVDLAIPRGTITGVIGANGSGKSTLLKVLAGDVRADSGTVRVLGDDPGLRPPSLRERTAYIAQQVELDPEITGEEAFRLFGALHGLTHSDSASRKDQLADAFGLRQQLHRLIGTYSGGLRQRLHIALGFVHHPELVLMDEPASALDPSGRAEAWDALHRFRDDGTTIVVVTHDTIEASRHCDAIVLLHHGRVAALAPPSELVANHGTWTLEIRLAGPAADRAVLAASIDLATTGAPAVAGNRLLLRASGIDADAAVRMKDSVIGRLQQAGETVLGFHLDPPDLSSAYFTLTGARIAPSDPATPRRRTGTGQRRMAA